MSFGCVMGLFRSGKKNHLFEETERERGRRVWNPQHSWNSQGVNHLIVDGFNPFENMLVKMGSSSPNRGEKW